MAQPRQVVVACDYLESWVPKERPLRAWLMPGDRRGTWAITTEKFQAQIFQTKDEAVKARDVFLNLLKKQPNTITNVSNFRIVPA